MGKAGVLLKGINEMQKMLQQEAKIVKENRKRIMIDACELLISDIKQSMINTQKSSIGILRQKGGKYHYPSLPYNPPAVDFSNLIKSIRYIIFEEKDKIIGDVGSYNVPYAAALEWGYAPRGLEPRPWLLPAVDRNQEKIYEKFGLVMSDVRYLK